MEIKNNSKIKAIIVAIILTSGLFFSTSFVTHSFTPLTIKSEDVITAYVNEGVYIQAKAYSPWESKKYLHRNINSKGYQPIQISIQNNTPVPLGLGDMSIGMPIVPPKKVSKTVLIDSIPRAIGLKVASFFFWPFMIPGAIDTIYTLKTHAKVKRDFTAKAIKNYEEIIPAYSTIHRIIFVKSQNFQDSFNLYLSNKETGRVYTYCCTVA